MELPIYQVDAFARGAFSGNPAAVVPLEAWLPDAVLQQIAEENNLSETAFFVLEEEGYRIRWFTPTVEVVLCGHATLATGHVLFKELQVEGDQITFNCKSGKVSVVNNDLLLTLDFPRDDLTVVTGIDNQLETSLGSRPIEVYKGRDDFMCVYPDMETIRNLSPDFGRLKMLPARGVIVTSTGDDEFDFVSRGFFPQSGVDEDPATGSAHTTLTPYWSGKLGKQEMTACQLSNRIGYLTVRDEGARIKISGQTSLYLKGKIYL